MHAARIANFFRRSPDLAAYLDSGRQWRHELASNIRRLAHWSDRLKLVREVAFPGRDYIA